MLGGAGGEPLAAEALGGGDQLGLLFVETEGAAIEDRGVGVVVEIASVHARVPLCAHA